MRFLLAVCLVAGCVGLMAVGGIAQGPPNERGPDDPIWVKWMDPAVPRDMTILDYWQREKRGELTPLARVDLGTMLAERGYPNDAVKMYRLALKEDSKLYEAWFRIGLVRHRQKDFDDARYAYKKCLKLLVGHGWCNFYIGLLEEQTNHTSKALVYYRRSFEVAPELADPTVNPEVLYSKLWVAPVLEIEAADRFAESMPLTFMEPDQVAAVQKTYEPTPTPTPSPVPSPQVKPAVAAPQPAAPREAAAPPGENRERRRARPTATPAPTLEIDDEKVESSPFGTGYRRGRPTGTPTEE